MPDSDFHEKQPSSVHESIGPYVIFDTEVKHWSERKLQPPDHDLIIKKQIQSVLLSLPYLLPHPKTIISVNQISCDPDPFPSSP